MKKHSGTFNIAGYEIEVIIDKDVRRCKLSDMNCIFGFDSDELKDLTEYLPSKMKPENLSDLENQVGIEVIDGEKYMIASLFSGIFAEWYLASLEKDRVLKITDPKYFRSLLYSEIGRKLAGLGSEILKENILANEEGREVNFDEGFCQKIIEGKDTIH